MRLWMSSMVLALITAPLTVGCSKEQARASAPHPVASGKLISVTVWEKPVQRPGETGQNSGNSPPEGSHVEVYDQFIIITTPNGEKILSLHGWYTNLRFKVD
jgi:hypothetical protein